MLKYLFTAQFADGTTFAQTPDDKSTLDPLRNCYYDVLQSGKRIVKFLLSGDGNTLSIDLRTGLFEVNGLKVLLEGDRLPTLPDRFDLIWYHQVTRDLNVTYDKQTGGILDTESQPEHREYYIGWQCTIAGKNYQQKIAVS